jgi:hypothetical protein
VRCQELVRETQALQMDKRELLLKVEHLSSDQERLEQERSSLQQSHKELAFKNKSMAQELEVALVRVGEFAREKELAGEQARRRQGERARERVEEQERETQRDTERENDRAQIKLIAREKQEDKERAETIIGKTQVRVFYVYTHTYIYR